MGRKRKGSEDVSSVVVSEARGQRKKTKVRGRGQSGPQLPGSSKGTNQDASDGTVSSLGVFGLLSVSGCFRVLTVLKALRLPVNKVVVFSSIARDLNMSSSKLFLHTTGKRDNDSLLPKQDLLRGITRELCLKWQSYIFGGEEQEEMMGRMESEGVTKRELQMLQGQISDLDTKEYEDGQKLESLLTRVHHVFLKGTSHSLSAHTNDDVTDQFSTLQGKYMYEWLKMCATRGSHTMSHISTLVGMNNGKLSQLVNARLDANAAAVRKYEPMVQNVVRELEIAFVQKLKAFLDARREVRTKNLVRNANRNALLAQEPLSEKELDQYVEMDAVLTLERRYVIGQVFSDKDLDVWSDVESKNRERKRKSSNKVEIDQECEVVTNELEGSQYVCRRANVRVLEDISVKVIGVDVQVNVVNRDACKEVEKQSKRNKAKNASKQRSDTSHQVKCDLGKADLLSCCNTAIVYTRQVEPSVLDRKPILSGFCPSVVVSASDPNTTTLFFAVSNHDMHWSANPKQKTESSSDCPLSGIQIWKAEYNTHSGQLCSIQVLYEICVATGSIRQLKWCPHITKPKKAMNQDQLDTIGVLAYITEDGEMAVISIPAEVPPLTGKQKSSRSKWTYVSIDPTYVLHNEETSWSHIAWSGPADACVLLAAAQNGVIGIFSLEPKSMRVGRSACVPVRQLESSGSLITRSCPALSPILCLPLNGHHAVTALAMNNDNIYIGTADGLVQTCDMNSMHVESPSKPVTSMSTAITDISVTAEHPWVLVAMEKGGCAFYNTASERVRHFPHTSQLHSQGLWDTSIPVWSTFYQRRERHMYIGLGNGIIAQCMFPANAQMTRLSAKQAKLEIVANHKYVDTMDKVHTVFMNRESSEHVPGVPVADVLRGNAVAIHSTQAIRVHSNDILLTVTSDGLVFLHVNP